MCQSIAAGTYVSESRAGASKYSGYNVLRGVGFASETKIIAGLLVLVEKLDEF